MAGRQPTPIRHWERRDPLRAELVIGDPTVSGLHISIYYDPQQQRFILENLRESNPAIVNGRKLAAGTTALSSPPQTYGLKCPNPKCGKVCAYDHLKLVCPWCGRLQPRVSRSQNPPYEPNFLFI
ncbi:MAG: FHA domain-containing protein [Pseudanabaenaceae cyanobacterium]